MESNTPINFKGVNFNHLLYNIYWNTGYPDLTQVCICELWLQLSFFIFLFFFLFFLIFIFLLVVIFYYYWTDNLYFRVNCVDISFHSYLTLTFWNEAVINWRIPIIFVHISCCDGSNPSSTWNGIHNACTCLYKYLLLHYGWGHIFFRVEFDLTYL